MGPVGYLLDTKHWLSIVEHDPSSEPGDPEHLHIHNWSALKSKLTGLPKKSPKCLSHPIHGLYFLRIFTYIYHQNQPFM